MNVSFAIGCCLANQPSKCTTELILESARSLVPVVPRLSLIEPLFFVTELFTPTLHASCAMHVPVVSSKFHLAAPTLTFIFRLASDLRKHKRLFHST